MYQVFFLAAARGVTIVLPKLVDRIHVFLRGKLTVHHDCWKLKGWLFFYYPICWGHSNLRLTEKEFALLKTWRESKQSIWVSYILCLDMGSLLLLDAYFSKLHTCRHMYWSSIAILYEVLLWLQQAYLQEKMICLLVGSSFLEQLTIRILFGCFQK